MEENTNQKKDLTSIIDLSQKFLEEEKNQKQSDNATEEVLEIKTQTVDTFEPLESLVSFDSEETHTEPSTEPNTQLNAEFNTELNAKLNVDFSAELNPESNTPIETSTNPLTETLTDQPNFTNENHETLQNLESIASHENINVTTKEHIIEPQLNTNQNPLSDVVNQANQKLETTNLQTQNAVTLFITGKFTPFQIEYITRIIASANLNIHPDEIKIQCEQGKLMIPRISKFAAVYFANKFQDMIETIQIKEHENS
jgi:hypothetical protein